VCACAHVCVYVCVYASMCTFVSVCLCVCICVFIAYTADTKSDATDGDAQSRCGVLCGSRSVHPGNPLLFSFSLFLFLSCFPPLSCDRVLYTCRPPFFFACVRLVVDCNVGVTYDVLITGIYNNAHTGRWLRQAVPQCRAEQPQLPALHALPQCRELIMPARRRRRRRSCCCWWWWWLPTVDHKLGVSLE
jgi:hypothetical protein